MDFYLLSVIAFVLLTALWLYRDRRNIERKFIVFYRKTTRGRDFLYRLADRFPRFWAVAGDLGVAVGFAGMAFVVYYLVKTAIFRPDSRAALFAAIKRELETWRQAKLSPKTTKGLP